MSGRRSAGKGPAGRGVGRLTRWRAREGATTATVPMQSTQCLECAHYLGLLQCEAFPRGVPPIIVTGQHDHRKPYPGDRGLRWVKRTPDSPLPYLPDEALERYG